MSEMLFVVFLLARYVLLLSVFVDRLDKISVDSSVHQVPCIETALIPSLLGRRLDRFLFALPPRAGSRALFGLWCAIPAQVAWFISS